MWSRKTQPNESEVQGKADAALSALGRVAEVRVGWGVPSYGPIFSQVYTSHLSVIAYASRYMAVERLGIIPMVGCTDKMYLHQAANEIVRQAKQANLTHLFWTETDMIPPHDAIPKLLALDKEIVSGVYFLRNGGGQPCLYVPTPVETKENPYLHTPMSIYDERAPFKLARYGGCPGMGCVLMKMSVFDKIEEPWFDLKANDHGKTNGYGQDLYFYTKAKWAKIEVWIEPSVICDQMDTNIVGYRDYRAKLAKGGEGIGAGGFIGADAANAGQSAA